MKKLAYIFSLLALLVGSLPISAQESKQYALYNYRNDGDFDAFMNVDIDSITYSCFDLDSVEHEDIVVQEVWTPAQVYRIPIEAIDSIGFRAPKTEYREGVFFITEQHVPYVKAIDDLNITFDSSTPASLLPSVGQVLVTETSEGLLDDGFAGRVTSIRNTEGGVEYVCEPVSLSDIFEQFSFVSKCSTESDMDVKSYLAKAPRRSFYDIGIDEVIKIDLDEVDCTPRDDDEEKIPVSFRYKPEMDITCLVSVVKSQPAVAKVLFHHSHSLYIKAKYEAEWGDSKEWWFSKKDIRIHIPIAAVDAVIKPYVNFGAFVDWNCKVKFEYELPLLKFEQTFGLDYSEYRPEEDRVQFINETEFIHDDPTISLSLDGSLAFGLALKLGAKLIHKKLLNFEAIFHVGPELKGHVDLSTDRIGEDANLYRQLKNTTVELDGYVAIPQASYQYFGSGVKLAKRGTWKGAKWSNKIPKTEDLLPNDKYPDGYMIDWPVKKWYIVPHFNVPEVYEASSTSAVATLYPYQNLLLPVKLGMAFENYTTGEVIEQDYGSYWGENHNAESDYVRTFDNLKASNIYKVYPTVSLLGMKMHAGPSTDYGVSAELVVSPQRLTINKGETGEVNVLGGTRDYDAIDDNSAIARSVSFNYNQGASNRVVLTVYGNSVGETYITILDKGNGSSQIVNVTVVDPNVPSLTLSTTSLSVDARTSNRVQITSGSGSYTAVSDHPEVVQVSVYDSNIAIEAYAAGTAIITVTDTQSGQTATIAVTVVDALPDLALSTSAVSLTVGGASTVDITSGSGSYTVASDNSSVATAALSGTTLTITPISAGTATITVTDTQSGQTATIAVTVTANNPTTDAVAVDLGLPSGTLWADRNVGASSPEDYGGYYAWGEIEEKEYYEWGTYKWCNDSYNTQTKYCTKSSYGTVDNKTVLDPEDDVAHVKWGGSWKMPTLDQVTELLDNCSSEWTTQNGVEGRKFTGPNGNSIFLPAAGGRFYGELDYAGSRLYYWSSTLHESFPYYACSLYFGSGRAYWDDDGRRYGFSVRPVR